MDITTVANIATILSLVVSVIAILVSLKVKQDYAKFKIKNQGNIGNMGTVIGDTIYFVMAQGTISNAFLYKSQTQSEETENSGTVYSHK